MNHFKRSFSFLVISALILTGFPAQGVEKSHATENTPSITGPYKQQVEAGKDRRENDKRLPLFPYGGKEDEPKQIQGSMERVIQHGINIDPEMVIPGNPKIDPLFIIGKIDSVQPKK